MTELEFGQQTLRMFSKPPKPPLWRRLSIALLVLLGLSGCGSCIDPFTTLSDCPSGTPGHHSEKSK
jgi:hypothetical protein